MVICYSTNKKLIQSLSFLICQTEIIVLDLPILCGFDEDAMSWVLMLALNATPTRTSHMETMLPKLALPCLKRAVNQALHILVYIPSELCSACSKK